MNLFQKIQRAWKKLRLQPIRVFCFHQVSETFNPETMWEGDWISTKDFKERIEQLKEEGYTFVSLEEAHQHISEDMFRIRKYAVLSADDGDKTIEEIIPWLVERDIPITLFVCSAFVAGEQREGKPRPMLLREDLKEILTKYPNHVSIGSHSVRHIVSSTQSAEEFARDVEQSESYLKQFANKIPYFAYPNGRYTQQTDAYLLSKNITPVYCDGQVNYSDAGVIHRELL